MSAKIKTALGRPIEVSVRFDEFGKVSEIQGAFTATDALRIREWMAKFAFWLDNESEAHLGSLDEIDEERRQSACGDISIVSDREDGPAATYAFEKRGTFVLRVSAKQLPAGATASKG